MMKFLLQRPLFIFDILLIASVIGISYLGKSYPTYLYIWTLTPIIYLALIGKLKLFDKTYLGYVFVVLPYLLYSQVLVIFNTGLAPGVTPIEVHFIPDNLYPAAITLLLIGALRILNAVDIFKALRIALPPVTAFVFILLSYDMFKSNTDVCRILGRTFLPFTPALFFSSITLLSFVGWSRLKPFERFYRYTLIPQSTLVVLAYTGSRGVALAFAICLGTLFFFTLVWRGNSDQPKPMLILVSGIMGLLLCALVELTTGCPAFMRVFGIFDALGLLIPSSAPVAEVSLIPSASANALFTLVSNASAETGQSNLSLAATTTYSNIFLRLHFWQLGWEAFMAAPWTGYGIFYEQALLFKEYGHTHVHNQYLSWLIWGGFPALCLGLAFLFAIVPFALRAAKFDALMIILATSVIMALSNFVDSYLRMDTYAFMHIILALLGLGIATQFEKEAREVATKNA